MRASGILCLLVVLGASAPCARAREPFVVLVVYALDDAGAFVLLANRADAPDVWSGFTGDADRITGDEPPDGAIRSAVAATRCHLDPAEIRRSVEPTRFQEPWDDPARVAYFARVPRAPPSVLEDDARACAEAATAVEDRPRLRWIPWAALRADVESAGETSGARGPGLVASAPYLHGLAGEHYLARDLAGTIRRMLAISERRDSTMEFTIPW